MICLSDQQRNSASQRKSNVAREWKSQPLWLVAENEQDEREYLSLRSLLSLLTEDFHLLSRGVEINHFLENPPILRKVRSKSGTNLDELSGSMRKLQLSYFTQLFALRSLSPFAWQQRFY